MKIDRLPASLLNGDFLHCQPIKGGEVAAAKIIQSDADQTPTFEKAIVCPARMSLSRCALRVAANNKDKHCLYYRGDSKGVYQIIGPGMDQESDRGWK